MIKESGHWYAADGTAVFEVPNKSKGGMRPTTLKDCRALGLYPSVTTIMKVLAAPELDHGETVILRNGETGDDVDGWTGGTVRFTGEIARRILGTAARLCVLTWIK